MKRYVYSFKHENAEYFLKPEINDAEPEMAKVSVLRDATKSAPQYAQAGLQECSFWFLGMFDDTAGVFESSPSMLISKVEIGAAVKKGIGDLHA